MKERKKYRCYFTDQYREEFEKHLSKHYNKIITLDEDNHTYLNNPEIQERLKYFQGRGYINGKTHTHLYNQEDERKYFVEAIGVTYASGICVKKYNENKYD